VLPGSCDSDPPSCSQRFIRKLLRYNPATDIWVTKASAPHFHKNGAGGVIDNKFYVAGGQDDGFNQTRNLDVYDPATNTWKTLAPMPSALSTLAGSALRGRLLVVGSTSDMAG
jgi:hypothetical protein